MLFIEIPICLSSGQNIIKYRNIRDDSWYYLYIDIETLNLLIMNFGIISTYRIPGKKSTCDNPTTGTIVKVNYCGADIEMHCGSKLGGYHLALSYLDQNY